jgi:uncharacterized protein YegP (UPF0339 family)
MASSFVIQQAADRQYWFNLRADNNETILTSETYRSEAAAHGGIQAVRINAPLDHRYVRKMSVDGRPYFVLLAANGETIGKSELYSSAAAMEAGIAAVKRLAPGATVVDRT